VLSACKLDPVRDVWKYYEDWRNENNAWLAQQEARTNADGTPYYQKVTPEFDRNAYVLIHYFTDRSATEGNLSPLISSTVDVKYKLLTCRGVGVDSTYLLTSPADSVYRSVLSANITGFQIALMATSEGDFSEALNFAGVWKVPVVFTIQNNQYAISVPVRNQTNSVNMAVKALAFGMPGIKVDGNDFFAMYVAYKEASEYARAGNGPVLIEAYTYRKGAHTTSDDPSKYRTKEEEQEWDKADPLKRLRKYMELKGIALEDDAQLIAAYKPLVEQQFAEAENFKPYALEDVFRHMYVDMPEDLKQQKADYEQFLSWKEKRK
jgi:hypothetical protein